VFLFYLYSEKIDFYNRYDNRCNVKFIAYTNQKTLIDGNHQC